MVVQHNLTAMNANRYLGINNSKLSKSLEKLSSGYAINRAGDNAAGLAVSEKMRSQIAGMTQAVKNAQDGISMVQTFEGALTETDSILQRMKVLANQSANGTYQDDVDRDAIQLEFDQLNDELNQIADTDFNGVIALNGGQMADGLKAEDGKFDYSKKGDQLTADIAAIDAQIAAEKAKKPADISAKEVDGVKVMGEATDIDDTAYTTDAAEKLWKDLKLDNTAKSVDISFSTQKDENGVVSYVASAGTVYDKDGNEIKKLTADELKTAGIVATAKNGSATISGAGGFDVKSASNTTAFTNAIFDATKVDTGDMLTLKFTGPAEKAKAPTNAGLADKYGDDGNLSTVDVSDGLTVGTNPSVTLGTGLTDANMATDADIKKILDKLNGAEVTVKVADGTNNAAVTDPANVSIAGAAMAAGEVTIDGQTAFAALNGGVLTLSTKTAAGGAGKEILKIDLGKSTNATGADGTYKFTIAIDAYSVPEAGAGPDVNVVAKAPDSSAIDEKVAELEAKKAALTEEGVSVSNAYDNAAIPMTYTETITLQAGARSKDAVEFTFDYKSNGIGKLKDNMDCSARAGGLNTESLSLKTAADANAAIDQIDHAINKVSMVRGTFGAIQNRLEHKIDNLNVSVENLTSAESQIRDTNMPTEMMNFTKQQILAQASQSMLAQANQLPQGVLSLLQ